MIVGGDKRKVFCDCEAHRYHLTKRRLTCDCLCFCAAEYVTYQIVYMHTNKAQRQNQVWTFTSSMICLRCGFNSDIKQFEMCVWLVLCYNYNNAHAVNVCFGSIFRGTDDGRLPKGYNLIFLNTSRIPFYLNVAFL